MAKTLEQWIDEANRKSDGGKYTGVVIFAKVENLSEAMRNLHGQFQHIPLRKALIGEETGHWKIVDVLGQDREGNLVQGGKLR